MTGSEELTLGTLNSLKDHNVVIWEKHGCLAVGENIMEAYDNIDIIAKSASIYFLCKSAGYSPQGLSRAQISEIRSKFFKNY
jgi:rhamnulose-1-phosphate aldolase